MTIRSFLRPPLTGWHIFGMLALFFGIIAIANIALVQEARRSFNGFTEENAYEKGLAYNAELERSAIQTADGWVCEVTYDSKAGQFSVRLSDHTGPITDAQATLDMVRPVHAGSDQSATLRPDTKTPGLYTADLRPSMPGQWEIRVHAHSNDRLFETRTRMDISG